MTYDEARTTMADWLERHASVSPERPHDGFELMDSSLPRGVDSRWNNIFVAFNFWDGWIDASNHDWQYYGAIRASDWPDLARDIASDLRADRDITNPVVLGRFGLRAGK